MSDRWGIVNDEKCSVNKKLSENGEQKLKQGSELDGEEKRRRKGEQPGRDQRNPGGPKLFVEPCAGRKETETLVVVRGFVNQSNVLSRAKWGKHKRADLRVCWPDFNGKWIMKILAEIITQPHNATWTYLLFTINVWQRRSPASPAVPRLCTLASPGKLWKVLMPTSHSHTNYLNMTFWGPSRR